MLVKAKDFEEGKIYVGTPVGEFYIKNGFYYWKTVYGDIRQINPDPLQIFREVEEVK